MELSVINKCYGIKKNIHLIAHGLRKEHRYGIGKQIEDSVHRILENILFAKQVSKHLKPSYLTTALIYLDLFRLDLRMMLDLKLLANETNIWKIHEETAELGRMLGGWLRSVK